MSQHGVARVRYFEGQYLRRQDFTDEQDYHLAMRRRHNVAHHVWGIVRGLQLVLEQQSFFLQPGLAIDGFGRELVLTHRQAIDGEAFANLRSDALDVWLLYDRQPSDPTAAGYHAAGGSEGAAFTRWREQPRVELSPRGVGAADPRRPSGVPPPDLEHAPDRTPPDDPDSQWPVFLGRIRCGEKNDEDAWGADLTGRPCAGLVAGRIESPWRNGTRVELGTEIAGESRFAIYVPEADTPDRPSDTQAPPRVEISSAGVIDIRADTALHGDLELVQGALEFPVGGAKPSEAESVPRPWQVYLQDLETGERELRIEMEASGDSLNRVVIGAWSPENGAFEPALSVADDRSVTVHGDLVVEGLLIRGRRGSEDEVTPEARSFLLSSYLTGLAAGGEPVAGGEDSTTAVLQAVADRLTASRDTLEDFAKLLKKEYPELRKELIAQLTGKLGG